MITYREKCVYLLKLSAAAKLFRFDEDYVEVQRIWSVIFSPYKYRERLMQ
jgi:hypothetical protein